MTQTAAITTAQNPAAAAPQNAALIPPAIDPSIIPAPTAEASRPAVQAPESQKQEAPMVDQPMPAAANDASVAPPEGKPLPKPPIHTVGAPMGAAANDAVTVEGVLAKFMHVGLSPDQRKDLMLDVTSTDVATDASSGHTLNFKIFGGAFNAERCDRIEHLLRNHPVLEKSHLEINRVVTSRSDGHADYNITVKSSGLSQAQMAELLVVQKPRGTSIAEAGGCTHGAGCSHCTTPAQAEKPAHPAPHGEQHHEQHPPRPHQDAAHAPHAQHDKPHAPHEHTAAAYPAAPHAPAEASTHAPAHSHTQAHAPAVPPQVDQPLTHTPPAVQSVVPPVTQVAAPLEAQGRVANNHGLQQSA